MSGATLGVVVISHRHEAFLERCLSSLQPGLQDLDTKVLLVDNVGDTDLTPIVSRIPLPVSVVKNSSPMGFAANCNQAIRRMDDQYVLLLNPDTVWLSGSLLDAVLFMESHPEAGILGCKLVDGGGEQQESYRRFPTLPVFAARVLGAERWPWRPKFYRQSLMEGQKLQAVGEVDLVTGAFFLLRRSCFDQIGGFDESFFMYYEDADFCYRARLAGFRTYFYPAISVLHHHQRSSRSITSPHARWHVQSALRYFSKHRYFLPPKGSQWAQL